MMSLASIRNGIAPNIPREIPAVSGVSSTSIEEAVLKMGKPFAICLAESHK
jgi:hypothetical protein